MKFVLLFLLLATVEVSSENVQFQAPFFPVNKAFPPVNIRIVGGVAAKPQQFPYQALLVINKHTHCGGTIIGNKGDTTVEWILTAGHCTYGGKHIKVILGLTDVNDKRGVQVDYTTNIFPHPQHFSGYQTLQNDIGLIRLSKPYKINEYINFIRLASVSPSVGETVRISGFGRTSNIALGTSSILMTAKLSIVDNPFCARIYGSNIVNTSVMCTSGSNIVGVCNGDSGGPLVEESGKDRRVVGIVSFGAKDACAAGYPDGYTRVTSHLKWIKEVTGITS